MTDNTFTVDLPDGVQIRLDKYCAGNCGLVRSRLKNGLQSAEVNGKPVKLSRAVKNGDRIRLCWEEPASGGSVVPEDIPLDILFENGDVTVVNKPQGMVTHPAAGNWSGTLANALLYHWGFRDAPEVAETGAGADVPAGFAANRPGIVHRLDKDTSGVLITARNPAAADFLQNEFQSRRVKKIYTAVLCGVPAEKRGVVDNFIFRDPANRLRFTCAARPGRGKHARTAYRVVAEYGDFSLVVFRIFTGRTHQIRVHSLALGCPVLGDPLYGRRNRQFSAVPMMLHARSLRIRLPGEDSPRLFRAPLPEHFLQTLHALRKTGNPLTDRTE
ncbi:MAG: RluA family pseudouridine synthase [Spirochaetes bacterium]|uniref:Pseudouridine synthase n=1 Tax=Candidatus Avitreponema avistercoris TaxID=2840705 RepID=A0A9D9ENJ0_9SPIR|nr:RluA family pseudouridine synthase [Candidatus Avitreponema avistercoris]